MERALREALGVSLWSEDRFDELRRVYLAMCAKIDDQLGRVISCLKAEGIYDDTAVLFFSDHGDYTGDYGIVEKAQNCFPECLTRIPLIIKPPKSMEIDNGINTNLVELTDICATVAQMAGITVERQNFSRSLVPTMMDKSCSHRLYTACEGGRLPEEAHCSEFSQDDYNERDIYSPRQKIQSTNDGAHTKAVMIRTEKYKYIRRLQEDDEFYVLEEGENRNYINDQNYAVEIAKHKEYMLEWYMRTCDLVPKKPDDRFTVEFLQNNMTALGMPKIVGRMIKLWLKISGKTAGQFADQMRKKAGH
jgi:arylsulfatase A-like enzyme